MPEVDKVYTLHVYLVSGETRSWIDIDLDEARRYLDMIRKGKDLGNDNYFISAKHVSHAEIKSRERTKYD